MNINGPKAQIVVKLAATTGQPTSSAPRIAATFGGSPNSNMSVDVFYNNNRIIYNNPYDQNKPKQGNTTERVSLLQT